MEKFKRIVLTLGLLGLLTILPVSSTHAANTGIQISPVTFNFEIKPGESQGGKILITNRNDETMNYVMELEIFDSSSEDGVPSFTVVKPKEGVSTFVDWVTFPDGDKGSIEVGKSKEVNFTISVPAGAEPGGHYGAIFAKQTKPLISEQNQVGVAARVGALVLISVPGNVQKGAQIATFVSPKFVWRGPVNMEMKVKNTGSVHYDSAANVALKPLLGSTVNVDLGTHTLIPNSVRDYKGTWNSKYPFGYYKVSATAQDGDKNLITTTSYLIAIPLIIVLPILVGLIIIIILVKYLKKKFKVVSK